MLGIILGAICLYTHSSCIWVVWKELRQHIKHADRRVEVYHYLRVLLMEREEELLRVNLKKFLSFWTQRKKTVFYIT